MTLPVLIVGAGPTGLTLALWLRRLGVDVRIIDKTAEAGTTSRALAVQGRTLEFYGQLGFAADVIRAGVKGNGVNLWVKGRKKARVPFNRIGEGMTRYPFVLIYQQDEHERLLIRQLAREGSRVERRTELVRLTESGDHVRATLRHANGKTERVAALFIAGCDGTHSVVRDELGIKFPGGTYEHIFYVADVVATPPAPKCEIHVDLDEADFVIVFPLKGRDRLRLVGTIRESRDEKRTLTFADIEHGAIDRLKVRVRRVNWFSTYHVHHRVAPRFSKGRAFLLGDAAHIHSPVGGQGMNTGIGDAVNLAWKLAAVLNGDAPHSLLKTYEGERIPFARRLVATTDRLFTFVTKSGRLARQVRTRVFPRAAVLAFHVPAIRRYLFRVLSELSINYEKSP
ncbi:MAG TPA: FAD-dependent monooxygenase, partial [Gemmatimonadaceae bacterium]|nr:FAD-dependent monooxygenase [Gemmatimonadaceae bacterium]